MIKDYIIIDDVLGDIDELVELSNNIKYYPNEPQIIEGMLSYNDFDPTPKKGWRGYRSDLLSSINGPLFLKVMNEIISKSFGFKYFTYNVSSFIHKSPEFLNELKEEDKWHIDSSNGGCLFAGVVYLNKNPERKSGTSLDMGNNIISVKNKYNRLVLYKSNILHSADSFFGNNCDNCRTTLTFFINQITFLGE